MFLLFRIVLILSITGSAVSLLLIALKPVTSKHFSPKWQYYIWITALITLVFPIPIKCYTYSSFPPPSFLMPATGNRANSNNTDNITLPADNSQAGNTEQASVQTVWRNTVAYAWAFGTAVYIMSALISYWIFLVKKKAGSRKAYIDISEAARRVGISKTPRIRISVDRLSPMLIGIIRPVIYLPDTNMETCLNLVLMHELTHYKRRDLLYKWVALIINGIHWFNPIAYIITSNINEACEISCDAEVTKNMGEEEKKKYMKTILSLIHS